MADIHLKKAHALAGLAAGAFKGATGISARKNTLADVANLHGAATSHAMSAIANAPRKQGPKLGAAKGLSALAKSRSKTGGQFGAGMQIANNKMGAMNLKGFKGVKAPSIMQLANANRKKKRKGR